MKVLKDKDGVLTNFEVLALLKSRGATTNPLGSLGAVSPSECKVFDYLVQSAACNQTRECINEFLKQSEKFNLNNFEKVNIINLRPSGRAAIYPLIESCETRLHINEEEDSDELGELVDMVVEILPPPPTPKEDDVQSEQIVEGGSN